MRFFHRKYQCYIVGEGSLVGQRGSISDLLESDNGRDSGVTSSITKSRSVFSLTSPNEYQVKVDIETAEDEARPSSNTDKKSSLSSDAGSRSGKGCSFDDGASDVSLPPKCFKVPNDNSVVFEDGKQKCEQFYSIHNMLHSTMIGLL